MPGRDQLVLVAEVHAVEQRPITWGDEMRMADIEEHRDELLELYGAKAVA